MSKEYDLDLAMMGARTYTKSGQMVFFELLEELMIDGDKIIGWTEDQVYRAWDKNSGRSLSPVIDPELDLITPIRL